MKIYKIMWLPRTKRVIWDIRNEQQLKLSAKPYQDIANLNFDFTKWAVEFGKLYQLWLEEDDLRIFDIHHDINRRVIEMLMILNLQTDEYKVLYWVDVNRDEIPDFEWQYCPISGAPLKEHDEAISRKNRYYSESFPIVMPAGR